MERLVSNYSHAREHLGYIDLTKQIYAATDLATA